MTAADVRVLDGDALLALLSMQIANLRRKRQLGAPSSEEVKSAGVSSALKIPLNLTRHFKRKRCERPTWRQEAYIQGVSIR